MRVLGPVDVWNSVDGPLDLGGPKQRALLAVLAAAGGEVVSTDRLIGQLWDGEPPARAVVSVQSYVANLRRTLHPDRAARAASGVLVTRPPGYLLDPAGYRLDADEFLELTRQAGTARATDRERAVALLDAAEALWRGDGYADVTAVSSVLRAEGARLDELRVAAREDRWRHLLELGEAERVVAETWVQVADHPLREAGWEILALALYRSRRQAEALDALRRARRHLSDELGVDPGPTLRALETAILRQDPALDLPPSVLDQVRPDRVPPPPPAPTPAVPVPGRDSALIGRDQALTAIAGALVDAAAGRGRLVLITGEPGIGKSSVARAATATASTMGLAVGWGTAEESPGAPALWPWAQALGQAVGQAQRVRAQVPREMAQSRGWPALADLVPALVGGPGAAGSAGSASAFGSRQDDGRSGSVRADPDTAAFDLAEGVATLVAGHLGPTLLVLDDLHWADDDTVRLLQRVARRADSVPLVVLATVRDQLADQTEAVAVALGDLARTDPVRIGLIGLAMEDVRTLVARLTGTVIDTEAAQRVRDRTAGNPFFIGELARFRAEGGNPADVLQPDAGDHHPGDRVPPGIRDLVRRRLAGRSDGARRLIGTASVARPGFSLTHVAAATEPPPGAGAAAEVIATGMIVATGPGTYRFSHALVRDAVSDGVDPDVRADLHARLARALPAGTPAERAFHWSQAGPAYARQAWTAAAAAAADAEACGAPMEAARWATEALACQDADVTASAMDRYRARMTAARLLHRIGQVDRGLEIGWEAVELARSEGDPVAAAAAVLAVPTDALWSWREYGRVERESAQAVRAVIDELPAGYPAIRAQLLCVVGGELYYDPAETETVRDLTAHAGALEAEIPDPRDRSRVGEMRHTLLLNPRATRQRFALADRLVRAAERAADGAAIARALIYRAADRIELGEVDAGVRDHARAEAVTGASAPIPIRVALSWAQIVMLIARGRFSEATAQIGAVEDLHSTSTLPGRQSVPVAVAASMHHIRGTLPEAEPILRAGFAATGLGVLADWHALALVRAGRRADARALLGPWAAQRPIAWDYLALTHLAVRAELWAALGDRRACVDLAALLTPFTGRIAVAGSGVAIHGFVDVPLGRAVAGAGDLDRAATLLDAAVHRNEETGLLPFLVAARRALAGVLERRAGPGDAAAAAALRDRAMVLAADLGMPLAVPDD